MPRIHRIAVPALLIALAGCWPGYRPAGNQASSDAHTYISTAMSPKTIRVIDHTTNTVLWSIDLPVGKQVTLQFYANHDPKNTARPDLMRWELSDAGREFGELHSSMPVPPASQRRIEWEHRKTPDVPTPETADLPKASNGTAPVR